MIDALFTQTNYVAAKKMLDVTAARMEAIQSNLANIETPNYRRLDVAPAFEAELRRAVASGDAVQISSLQPRLEADATAVARRRDGNSVELEDEMVRLYRNSLEHQVETQLITGSLLKMRLAITGRPG
jgi:flagellar basal-body rod protein FlgB